MKHRAVIEQAKGLLMGAEGVDEEQAFQILVRASQRENIKLRAIAQRITKEAVDRGRVQVDGKHPAKEL
jgi:AmiR/NasT family two-component response regulator